MFDDDKQMHKFLVLIVNFTNSIFFLWELVASRSSDGGNAKAWNVDPWNLDVEI